MECARILAFNVLGRHHRSGVIVHPLGQNAIGASAFEGIDLGGKVVLVRTD
jgi:hypothetical protein